MSDLWVPATYKREPDPPAVRADDGSRYNLYDRHDELLKAASDANAAAIPYRMNQDMYGFGAYQGVKDLPSALITTMTILRQIPVRNPVAAAVIRHRQNQAGNYHRRARFEGDTGFRVGARQKDKKPTPAAKKKMRLIEDVLIDGGLRKEHPRTGKVAVWDAEFSHRAMGIARAARAIVGDTLTLDAGAIRIQPGLNAVKNPVSFWDPADAALVRYAIPKEYGKHAVAGAWGNTGAQLAYRPEIRPGLADCAYVTVSIDGSTTGEYSHDEMGYLVRNPRTDEWVMGYGFSELEQLISVITGLLYGISYNTEFFDNNHVPPGILALPGDHDDKVLKDMRYQLRTMCGGPGQYWAMPIMGKGIQGGTAEYIPLREANGEGMYWKEWILFCANIACALYGMDSSEINMTNFGASSNALGNNSGEARIDSAQENGKEPMLASLSAFWDENIVQAIEPDFVFEYLGLSDPDEEMQMAKSTYRSQTQGSTPNMERALQDKRPIYDPLDRPLWNKVTEFVKGKMGEDADQDEVEEMIAKLYEKSGGALAQWPDAPVSCPGALTIWQIEHNVQAPAPMVPGMPGQDPTAQGGPNDPNAQAIPGQPVQPGQQDFPQIAPTKPIKPAPGPAGKPDEDTHVSDVGSMLLRRQPAGNQMQKSVIEVVVRRR